jgi:hypothetical protein
MPPHGIMKALAVTTSSCTENEWASQQLGRASALAQTGFCGWLESVLATAD